MIKGLDPVATPRTASGRCRTSSAIASAANFPASSEVALMTTSIALSLPLPRRPPINPDSAYLPVAVEEDRVGDISRLQAADPVLHSKNLSRDDGGGFDRRERG